MIADTTIVISVRQDRFRLPVAGSLPDPAAGSSSGTVACAGSR